MSLYVAIIDGQDSVWGVRIPDFPGCHGGGATPAEAVEDATRALREFAADMTASGEAIPAPTDYFKIIAKLKRTKEPFGGVVYIPLLLDKSRSVRANISLDAGLLEQIDAEAKRRGLTRSSFIVSAAIDKIARVD
jgi:predicted RNase H-like HicB family nuclease